MAAESWKHDISKNWIMSILNFEILNLWNVMCSRFGVHFGAQKKRKVATKLISYERYGEILFQKVASGYFLHFVQDGSSKNARLITHCTGIITLCTGWTPPLPTPPPLPWWFWSTPHTLSAQARLPRDVFLTFSDSSQLKRLVLRAFWAWAWPDLHFGVLKTRKVATKTISYQRYGEILFQKVALCYLLHFVQDGSSKNALENLFLRKNVKNRKLGRTKKPSLPLETLEAPREHKSVPRELKRTIRETEKSPKSSDKVPNRGPGRCCAWLSAPPLTPEGL